MTLPSEAWITVQIQLHFYASKDFRNLLQVLKFTGTIPNWFSEAQDLDLTTHIQEKTKHKLYFKHMFCFDQGLQGSEVNAKQTGTLQEEHSWWILLRSLLFIYPNSVKTNHLPPFLFNLQETKKNTSGFRHCVDPKMCRTGTPIISSC